jgi:serine/threonine protein kinase
MNKYEVTKTLGEGAFGCVYMARNKTNNVVVAIKHIKRQFATWQECLEERELKSLRKLKGHRAIVGLLELIHQKQELYFVFEFVTSNLMDVIEKQHGGFTETRIKHIFFELLGGMTHMHRQGFFHRDIKPENLLCKPDGSRLQIADLGLAREIRSRPPYTDYTSTRWYRAPEVVLRSTVYRSMMFHLHSVLLDETSS